MLALDLSIGSTRRRLGGALTAGWAVDDSVIDYDFVNHRYAQNRVVKTLGQALTFTRSGAADWLLADGVTLAAQAATDVIRRDARGALLEPAITVQPTNTAHAGHTVGVIGSGGAHPTRLSGPSTTAGVTVELISVVGNVIRYRCYGTTTTTWQPNFSWISEADDAANGQNWHGSVFARLVAGTWPLSSARSIIQQFQGFTLLGQLVGDGPAVTAASMGDFTWRRYWTNATLNNASVNRCRFFFTGNANVASGVAVDFTIEFQLPQRYIIPAAYGTTTGAGVSPVISPASGTVTQAAETLTTPLAVHSAGTIVMEAVRPLVAPTSAGLFAIHEANVASANTQFLRINGTNLQFGHAGGAVAQSFAGVSAGATFRVAAAWGGGSAAISINGATAATGSYTAPGAAALLASIGGATFGTNAWGGFIRRVYALQTNVGAAALPALSA